jgi:hypothetical protein
MKKKAIVALLAVLMLSFAASSNADRYQRNQSDNPFRLVGYVLHPVGIGLEYGVMRPIHWLVSQPDLDIVFGHQSHPQEDGTYFEWVHGDFSPSIAEEYQGSDGTNEKARARQDKARSSSQAQKVQPAKKAESKEKKPAKMEVREVEKK